MKKTVFQSTVRLGALCLAFLMLLTGCQTPDTPPVNGTGDTGNTTATEEEMTTTQEEILIDPADVIEYTAADIRALETRTGKKVAVSIDVVCQLCEVNFRLADVRDMMLSIRNLGINRVYLIMCSPDYPVMSGGMITAVKEGMASTHIETALKNLGDDPNKIFIEMCHEYGMEAIAVIKPYEGGGGVTIPEGTTLDAVASKYGNTAAPETIGGHRAFMDAFIAKHPEMRVQRKPNSGQTSDGPVTKMEIYYQIGSDKTDLTEANKDAANAPTIWVSRDNAGYEIYKSISWKYDRVDNFPIYDANGDFVFNRNCVRLTVEITGLADEFDYIACSLPSTSFIMKSDYWCRPYGSMTALYSGSTKLATTLGYYVRTPYDKNATPETMKWGSYGSPADSSSLKGIDVDADGKVTAVYKEGKTVNGAESFYKWGFEYEFVYTSAVTNGFFSPVIALGVGKNEYVQGLLCEGYEEVRDYWLEQVETALSYGADGIDIRWDGHSAMVSDFYYYGYNKPIADEYLKQYGKALESEPVNKSTAARVATIRGEFFLKFLTEASKKAHDAGAIFLSHFFATSYTANIESDSYPLLTSANQVAQWKMPKILVRDYKAVIDLCDEIVYKDYFSTYYAASEHKIGQILTDYAKANGKKIWVHCYVQQSPKNLNSKYMENIANSTTADGTTLYEITPSFDYGTAKQMISTYLADAPKYSISLVGRISTVAKGTTARDLIEELHMLGQYAVVDAEGKSLPLDTVLTGDMRLCLNGSVYYKLSIGE